jgi:hypothetical protein
MWELAECYKDLPELQQKAMLRMVRHFATWQGSLTVEQLQEAQDDILGSFNDLMCHWQQNTLANLDPARPAM